jgi:putative transferase (TIGR04331 family)
MVYIVTTSIEKKFLQNEDCIFAGRWCLKDSLEDINITDENTPLYHWDVKGLLSSDRFYLSYINEQVLIKLSKCLNEVLETSNDTEYWRLVVGYWVNIYCTVLFDRWQILKSCVDKVGTANILSLEVVESQFSTCDLDEFIKLSTESSEWNYYLFLKIADEFKSINKIYLNEKLILKKYSKKRNFINKFIQKYIIKKLYSIVFSFNNIHKFYSIKTYLPFIYELQLKLKIGEFPVLKGASFFDSERIDSNNNLRKLIKLEANLINDPFLEFTLKMVKDFLPTIYLEGYWQTLEDLKPAKTLNKKLKIAILPNRINSLTKNKTITNMLSELDAVILENFVPSKNLYTQLGINMKNYFTEKTAMDIPWIESPFFHCPAEWLFQPAQKRLKQIFSQGQVLSFPFHL